MISFIGDVHGRHDRYHLIQRKCPWSVQLGDFGFEQSWTWLRPDVVDPSRHRILAGNHDCYPVARETPYYLGDFGVAELAGTEFFFARGAFSVDKEYRVAGVDWWEEEELSDAQFRDAIRLYAKTKPDVVVSHDCPSSVLPLFATNAIKSDNASRTNASLQMMLEFHRPHVWVFGHHHITRRCDVHGTHFQCVGVRDRWDLQYPE